VLLYVAYEISVLAIIITPPFWITWRRLISDFRRTQLEEIEPRLSDELELAFFRIAQEAMANVSKHAEATCVTLKLGRYEGGVRLSISDDGRGFDPCRNKPSDSGAGWGLAIMRERAESVRARFSLDSRPGRGTVLSVETGEV
jgi:signal transduction histidine kinase